MADEALIEKGKCRTNWFMGFLTWFLISGFMTVLLGLFLVHVPESNKETLIYMAGQLSGFTSAVVAFWTSQNSGSERTKELLANSVPATPKV